MQTRLETLSLDALHAVTGGDPGGRNHDLDRSIPEHLLHPPKPKCLDPIAPQEPSRIGGH